jgi:hypothetical protein
MNCDMAFLTHHQRFSLHCDHSYHPVWFLSPPRQRSSNLPVFECDEHRMALWLRRFHIRSLVTVGSGQYVNLAQRCAVRCCRQSFCAGLDDFQGNAAPVDIPGSVLCWNFHNENLVGISIYRPFTAYFR